VTQLEAELMKSSNAQQLQDEIRELRADLRALRDKNHQLVQDNILLTEHLRDATRDQRTVSPSRRSPREEQRPTEYRHQSSDRYRGIG
jgi:regulator of replication initiation timing